ncbi:MAG: hypothetical protein ABSE16_02700 [Verrucomicrobiota bacterium]
MKLSWGGAAAPPYRVAPRMCAGRGLKLVTRRKSGAVDRDWFHYLSFGMRRQSGAVTALWE